MQHQILQALIECLHILDLAQNQLLNGSKGEHLTITYLIYSCLIIVLSLSYHYISYHCLIIVLSLSYHCLILCYCLAVHVDRDWDSTGLRVSAPFPPRLVCRKGRFCLSHIGGRHQGKRLWRLPSESSPPGHVHCSNIAPLVDELYLIPCGFSGGLCLP